MIDELIPPLTTPRGRPPGAGRAALIRAATALFAERGFDGVTVEQLARRARVNKAMVSYYFGGKARLYNQIVRSTLTDVLARLEPLREDPRPAPERLQDLVRTLGDVMARHHPHLPSLLLREVAAGGRRLERDVLPLFVSVFGIVAAVIADGVRKGSFRRVNPLFSHLSVMGSLLFFFASEPFRTRLAKEGLLPLAAPLDAMAYVRHVEELAARGLAPEAGGME